MKKILCLLLILVTIGVVSCQKTKIVERIIIINRADVDINKDGIVNRDDFNVLASEWGKQGENLKSDFNKDCIVDLRDMAVMANYWLEEE